MSRVNGDADFRLGSAAEHKFRGKSSANVSSGREADARNSFQDRTLAGGLVADDNNLRQVDDVSYLKLPEAIDLSRKKRY